MAFFTRVNLNVPVLPPEDSLETNSVMSSDHRRYASEPSNVRPCNFPSSLNQRSAQNNIKKINSISTSTTTASTCTSTNTSNGASPVEPSASSITEEVEKTESKNNQNNQNSENSENSDDSEPKRYEYVVDRVLGVEV